MKIIRKGEKENYDEFYPGEYEFKLCGGSVEPKDRIIHEKDDEKKEVKEV